MRPWLLCPDDCCVSAKPLNPHRRRRTLRCCGFSGLFQPTRLRADHPARSCLVPASSWRLSAENVRFSPLEEERSGGNCRPGTWSSCCWVQGSPCSPSPSHSEGLNSGTVPTKRTGKDHNQSNAGAKHFIPPLTLLLLKYHRLTEKKRYSVVRVKAPK